MLLPGRSFMVLANKPKVRLSPLCGTAFGVQFAATDQRLLTEPFQLRLAANAFADARMQRMANVSVFIQCRTARLVTGAGVAAFSEEHRDGAGDMIPVFPRESS